MSPYQVSEGAIMKHTVLIVDDGQIFQELTAAVLRKAGYRVLCATDGSKALELIEDSLPDVMVLDLALPRLSGPDLLQCLRERPEYRSLPVIVFSGSSSQDAMAALRGLQVDECLVKGRDPLSRLLASINRAIERQPHRMP